MAGFSIPDVAFAGFKAVARRPAIFAWWMGFAILTAIVVIGVVGLLMGSAIFDMIRLASRSAEPSSAAVFSFIGRMLLGLLLILPLALVFAVMRVSAANRAILRPEDDRFGYLRLGVEEVRVLAVLLVIYAMQFAAQMVIGIVTSLIFGGLMMARIPSGSPQDAFALVGIQMLSAIPTWAAIIFINVKFCLAVPQTLDTRAINIGGSWTLTKGRFWPIVGVYVINILIMTVIGFGVIVLLGGVMAVVGLNLASLGGQVGNDPAGMFQAMGARLLPTAVFVALVFSAVSVINSLLMSCPGPAIYRAVTVNKEAEVF